MDNQKKQEIQNKGKEIYDNIIIPTELDDIVRKTIASRDKESIDRQYRESHSRTADILKYVGAVAAVIVVSIIVGLNSSESFAREMSEVPVLGSVAKAFTVRNYTVKKDELTVKENVPETELIKESQTPETIPPVAVSGNNVQIETEVQTEEVMVSGNDIADNTVDNQQKVTISGNDIIVVEGEEKKVVDTLTPPLEPITVSSNTVYEQAATVNDFVVDINKKIDNYVQKFISDETNRFEEYKTAFFETGGTEKEWADRKFDIAVDYELKYQRGAVVSFVITATENWRAAYEERTFYNLDLLNGKEVVLSDLLGIKYIDVANVQIVRQMKERVKQNPDYIYWGVTDEGLSQGFDGFTSVDADTNFYINELGNPVICFDKYEIAPGFMGEQEFEIVVTRK